MYACCWLTVLKMLVSAAAKPLLPSSVWPLQALREDAPSRWGWGFGSWGSADDTRIAAAADVTEAAPSVLLSTAEVSSWGSMWFHSSRLLPWPTPTLADSGSTFPSDLVSSKFNILPARRNPSRARQGRSRAKQRAEAEQGRRSRAETHKSKQKTCAQPF